MGHITGSVATRQSSARPLKNPSGTLVWIDSRTAFVVRWHEGSAKVERFDSDVPVHRHSTGRDSSAPQDEVESRRLEHLARFVGKVTAHISAQDDLFVLGPGTVHEQLALAVELSDRHARRQRRLESHKAGRMTERELVAELRAQVGAPAPRKKHSRRPVIKPPTHTKSATLDEFEPVAQNETDRS